MSGVVSGIGKVFSAVGNTAAKVTKSIASVGATVFTAGAATGAAPIAQGGLSNIFGQGTLGKVIQGAVSRAVPGALMGGAVGALTGQGFMKGAMIGGLGGAAFGGAEGAGLFKTSGMQQGLSGQSGMNTLYGGPGDDRLGSGGGLAPGGFDMSRFGPQTNIPVKSSQIDVLGAIDRSQPDAMTATAVGQSSSGGGLFQKGLDFLGSERGGQLLAGLGQGASEYLEAKRIMEERERHRQFIRDNQQRVTDSYKGTVVPSNVVANEVAKMQAKPRYMFDPGAGRIVLA